MGHVLWRIGRVVVVTLAIGAGVVRADIDATGYWAVSVDLIGPITQHWVQSGPTLVIDGTAGSIDPQTGVFSVLFPPNPGDPCQPDYSSALTGTVAPDGQTFTGQIALCADSPTTCCVLGGGVSFEASGSQIVVVCGDGIIEGPETCDDGNSVAGDGCDATCQVEPCHFCSGQPSMCSPLPAGHVCDDGNSCTLNACDASGTCVVTGLAPAGSPCEDGDLCTANACDASGTCAVTNASISCDDGNECTIDSCNPLRGCLNVPTPRGTRCDAGNLCTESLCDAGVCSPAFQLLDCDDGNVCTDDACDPQLGCVHTPDVRSCRSAQVTTLLVRDNTDDSKDKLLWKWTQGESTSQNDFGMPTVTTAYTLCVFAGSTNAVVAEAEIAPDAQKWTARGSRGFTYKDPSGTADGIDKIVLATGASNRAKVIVQGLGAALSFNAPPFTPPVTTQLTNSSTNACWSATYGTTDASRNVPGLFKAKTKTP